MKKKLLKLIVFLGIVSVLAMPIEITAEEYEYDSLGRVVKVTDDNGNEWFYEYDANGNILKVTGNVLQEETAGESETEALQTEEDKTEEDKTEASTEDNFVIKEATETIEAEEGSKIEKEELISDGSATEQFSKKHDDIENREEITEELSSTDNEASVKDEDNPSKSGSTEVDYNSDKQESTEIYEINTQHTDGVETETTLVISENSRLEERRRHKIFIMACVSLLIVLILIVLYKVFKEKGKEK